MKPCAKTEGNNTARKNTYAEQKWSRLVRARAGGICQFCGSSNRPEAHHIKPVSEYPELVSVIENGICLCHRHHLAANGGAYNRYKQYFDPTIDGVLGNATGITLEEITQVQAFIQDTAGQTQTTTEE